MPITLTDSYSYLHRIVSAYTFLNSSVQPTVCLELQRPSKKIGDYPENYRKYISLSDFEQIFGLNCYVLNQQNEISLTESGLPMIDNKIVSGRSIHFSVKSNTELTLH